MKKESKKDSAVSPVIGTILLVAITVVLVAIISAVVMGMSGDVDSTHTVGLKVINTSSGLSATITGGDVSELTHINAKPSSSSGQDNPKIGATYVLGGTMDSIIIGTFSDGSTQILWSK